MAPTINRTGDALRFSIGKSLRQFLLERAVRLSPSTAGSLIRAKQPDVVKLRNGDIKKNWSDASVFAVDFLSQ
jgi:hypothetical protein